MRTFWKAESQGFHKIVLLMDVLIFEISCELVYIKKFTQNRLDAFTDLPPKSKINHRFFWNSHILFRISRATTLCSLFFPPHGYKGVRLDHESKGTFSQNFLVILFKKFWTILQPTFRAVKELLNAKNRLLIPIIAFEWWIF